MANAFTNIDNCALQATRNAELEAYRRRLIAYDADPAPRSPDLTELANVDTNDDGYTWDSDAGRWEGLGEETGVSITPSLIYPVEHEDCVWIWWAGDATTIFDHANESVPDDAYVEGVITSPTNGVLPVTTESWNVPNSKLVGNPSEATVGDRIIYMDDAWGAHHGIYVVVDTGSETTPWVIERAADHPVEDLLLPFAVKSPYGAVRTQAVETTPQILQHLAVSASVGIVAGTRSVASGGIVLGNLSHGYALDSISIGHDNVLADSATGSIAIGAYITNDEPNTIIIGSNSDQGSVPRAIIYEKYFGDINPVTVDDVATYVIDFAKAATFLVQLGVEFSDLVVETANVRYSRTVRIAFTANVSTNITSVVWPNWVWLSYPRADFVGASAGLLTLISFGPSDEATYATFQDQV